MTQHAVHTLHQYSSAAFLFVNSKLAFVIVHFTAFRDTQHYVFANDVDHYFP